MPESPTADSSSAQPSQPAYPPPPGANPPATPDNLADFFSAPAAAPPDSPQDPRAQSSTAHIDDMFSAAPKPPPPVRQPQPAASPAASSSAAGSRGVQGGSAGAGAGVRQPTPKPAPKAAPASMIDFGNEAAMLAEHPDLYKGLEEVPGITSFQYGIITSVPASLRWSPQFALFRNQLPDKTVVSSFRENSMKCNIETAKRLHCMLEIHKHSQRLTSCVDRTINLSMRNMRMPRGSMAPDDPHWECVVIPAAAQDMQDMLP